MQLSREEVANALLNQLQTANGAGPNQFQFNTFSRAPKIWSEVPDASQPAAFLFKLAENLVQNNRGLVTYILEYRLLIYLKVNPASDSIPETEINQILDAIDAAMQGSPIGQPQTLGLRGVNLAWIEGEIMVDTGALDQQVCIVIPIKVRCGI